MGAAVLERARSIFQPNLPEEFGWVDWLDKEHLRLFAGELHDALQRAAGDEEFEELLDAWKATAEMDHSPELQREIERNRRGRFVPADEWPKQSIA